MEQLGPKLLSFLITLLDAHMSVVTGEVFKSLASSGRMNTKVVEVLDWRSSDAADPLEKFKAYPPWSLFSRLLASLHMSKALLYLSHPVYF